MTGAAQVQIPACYGAPEILEKRERVRIQVQEAMTSGVVFCACSQRLPVYRAFRCLYCGEFYCTTCGERHFGMTKREWEAAKNK